MHWCRASAEPKRTEARGRSARLYAPAIGVWGAQRRRDVHRRREPSKASVSGGSLNTDQFLPGDFRSIKTPRYLDYRLPTPLIEIIDKRIIVASKRGLKRRSSSCQNTSPSSTTLAPTDSRRSTEFQQHHDVMISSEITQSKGD